MMRKQLELVVPKSIKTVRVGVGVKARVGRVSGNNSSLGLSRTPF